MKKLYLFICLSIGLFSCNQENSLVETDNDTSEASLRAINQNQNIAFDWEDIDRIQLLNVTGSVILPWYNAAAGQVPFYIIEDYKKKDGWVMVYNFCTDPNEYEDRKYYLMFYNKLTGLFRVFYYNKNNTTNGSSTFWQMGLSSASKYLNSVGHFTLPLDKVGPQSTYTTNMTTVESKSIYYGWNCFDIELAYDPNIKNQRQLFNIGLHDKSLSEVVLTGDVDLKSEGTIISTSSSNPVKDMTNSAAKQVGKAATTKIGKMLGDKKILPLISNTAISTILGGGVGSLVSSGINLVFGSFLGKSNKETKTVQDLSFKTTGTITINGTISSNLSSAALPIQNLVMPGSQTTSGDRLLPVYNKPLGVWNIEKTPIIIVEKAAWALGENRGIYSYSQAMYIDRSSIVVNINPETQEMINKYEVSSEIIYYYKYNGNLNWNNDTYPEYEISKGELIYKDNDNEFYRYPKLNYNGGTPSYDPPFNPGVIQCMPHNITSGRIKKNFVIKITLTLYPKADYGTDPIIMTRTYIPEYKIVHGAEECYK